MRGNLLTLGLLFILPAVAGASQIAIGLDWGNNVFVQEYWQDGKARYAIFNNRPDAIRVIVNDVQFVTPPGTETFRAVDGKDLAAWDIKSKQVVHVDAPKSPGGDGARYFRFRIENGKRLGVLTIPVAPADMAKGKIVSCDGINGSGGRRRDVWYEQDSITFEANGIIEVKLNLPASGATITFKKNKAIENPVEAIIAEVECATLRVLPGKMEFTIDTSNPIKATPIHVVTLRFRAPKVDAPTMVAIDGWVSVPSSVPGQTGGGYHVIRGLIVQHAK